MVVFGQRGCIRAKVDVFVKVVVFRKMVVFGQTWFFSGKVVILG